MQGFGLTQDFHCWGSGLTAATVPVHQRPSKWLLLKPLLESPELSTQWIYPSLIMHKEITANIQILISPNTVDPWLTYKLFGDKPAGLAAGVLRLVGAGEASVIFTSPLHAASQPLAAAVAARASYRFQVHEWLPLVLHASKVCKCTNRFLPAFIVLKNRFARATGLYDLFKPWRGSRI